MNYVAVQVATAVREDGRRKRTDVIQVTVEIANPPHDLAVTVPGDLTADELDSIASRFIDTYQLGELDNVLGTVCVYGSRHMLDL